MGQPLTSEDIKDLENAMMGKEDVLSDIMLIGVVIVGVFLFYNLITQYQ